MSLQCSLKARASATYENTLKDAPVPDMSRNNSARESAISARLTEGAIGSTLLRLSLPMIGGLLGIVAFNLVDTAAALNVLRRPFRAAGLSVGHMFLLYVPLAFLGSRLFGITGVFGGIASSFVIAGIVAHLISRPVIRHIVQAAQSC